MSSPRDPPNPGIDPSSLAGGFFTEELLREAHPTPGSLSQWALRSLSEHCGEAGENRPKPCKIAG